MNYKEKQLIIALRHNSRANIKEIAQKLGCPISTLYDTLHKLENKKLIEYTAKIDYEKLGYPIQAIIILKTASGFTNKLHAYLKSRKELNTIYRINNNYSYCVEAICKSQHELDELLEDLETNNTLTQINVYTIIETIQKEKHLIE
jgi:Lrp/AsnC family transcriptional regulator, leucine-responsive regulatory protein